MTSKNNTKVIASINELLNEIESDRNAYSEQGEINIHIVFQHIEYMLNRIKLELLK